MSSQRSSTIKSSNASSPNEETKYKSNDVIQGFNMTTLLLYLVSSLGELAF